MNDFYFQLTRFAKHCFRDLDEFQLYLRHLPPYPVPLLTYHSLWVSSDFITEDCHGPCSHLLFLTDSCVGAHDLAHCWNICETQRREFSDSDTRALPQFPVNVSRTGLAWQSLCSFGKCSSFEYLSRMYQSDFSSFLSFFFFLE